MGVATDESGGLPAGTGLVLDTGGVGSIAVPGVDFALPGWFGKHLARAVALAGINAGLVAHHGTDFETAVLSNQGGTTAPVFTNTARGGVLVLDTSATASRTSQTVFSQQGTFSAPKTSRMYLVAHAKLNDLGDSVSQHEMGVCVGGAAGIHDQAAGVGLSMQNGVMNLELRTGSVSTIVATTWTPETTLYHDFAFSYDLTTVIAWVDGVNVGSTAVLTNFPTGGTAGYFARTINAATAASRRLDLDEIRLFFEKP